MLMKKEYIKGSVHEGYIVLETPVDPVDLVDQSTE